MRKNIKGVKSRNKKIDNPHDKRFKELFANKSQFISLLKDCVKEPWVNDIDESTLRKSNNSFILQDFSEKEADIVYEAILNDEKIIFYILLEHQSKVDHRMPYRLLLYIVEMLRYYYNNADVTVRDSKDFKFPVVFPIVLFTGSEKWTVPINIKEMFSNPEQFGEYVLNFKYMLLDAKGYNESELKMFSSKLLGIILLLEKSKNDVEFYGNIRNNLNDIRYFDKEEKRILNMCIKVIDLAYGYNKSEEIKVLLENNDIAEVDSMLCDVIENAKYEKENLILQGKLEIAKKMLLENLPITVILKVTNLSKEQVEKIKID